MSISKYTLLFQIGEGSFGSVYKACYNNEYYAVKKIDMKKNGLNISVINEINSLKRLKHGNIIELIDYYALDHMYIVMPYYEYDLAKYIRKNKNIPMETTLVIIKQILQGINHIHNSGFIHTDIKPNNILINNTDIKIIDFGLCEYHGVNPVGKKSKQNINYRAPEIILSNKYGYSVDIWGIGCIMFELINGVVLFKGQNEIDQITEYFRVLDNTWPGYPLKAKYTHILSYLDEIKDNSKFNGIPTDQLDLLKSMLTINPDTRISSSQALNKYFNMKLKPEHEMNLKLLKNKEIYQINTDIKLIRKIVSYGSNYIAINLAVYMFNKVYKYIPQDETDKYIYSCVALSEKIMNTDTRWKDFETEKRIASILDYDFNIITPGLVISGYSDDEVYQKMILALLTNKKTYTYSPTTLAQSCISIKLEKNKKCINYIKNTLKNKTIFKIKL